MADNFTDEEFPPNEESLGLPDLTDVAWERASGKAASAVECSTPVICSSHCQLFRGCLLIPGPIKCVYMKFYFLM